MIILDFRCAHGHTQENFVPSDTQVVGCKTCGHNAKRIISGTSVKLDGTDPAYPTAGDKWAKQHEKAGGQTYDE